MEKAIQTLADLAAEASRFAKTLTPSPKTATLVTLSGELGAGKTAFTKAVAQALDIEETVTSPTFVLEKIYSLQHAAFARLIHIDAYRLESGSELTPLGFGEVLQDPTNLILLEWPEKVSDALPKPAIHITLAVKADGLRTISYE